MDSVFDQMNVRAVDDGDLISTPGTLTVNVDRNNFTPEILNMPSSTTVRSDISTTQVLFSCSSRDNDTVVSLCYSFPTYNFEFESINIILLLLHSCIKVHPLRMTLAYTIILPNPSFRQPHSVFWGFT